MAVSRTPFNIPGSSITHQTVKPLSGFRRGESPKFLKLPLPGKTAFICMAILILSALAGAITPWFLSAM